MLQAPPIDVTLNVNIPLLFENVPDGWTVCLVDNPGFNEANKQHIQQLADASVMSSAAYVFLTEIARMNTTATADFFRRLSEMDTSNFVILYCTLAFSSLSSRVRR